MSEPTTPTVQVLESATRDDVRPGDHIVWEWARDLFGAAYLERREGIAHRRDEAGDWWTEDGGCIINGEGAGITITIRRAVQELPTEAGTVIVPAEGHEYITATVFGVTFRAREAILISKTQWHAAWRSDGGVLIYVDPERIDPDTWKVDDR